MTVFDLFKDCFGHAMVQTPEPHDTRIMAKAEQVQQQAINAYARMMGAYAASMAQQMHQQMKAINDAMTKAFIYGDGSGAVKRPSGLQILPSRARALAKYAKPSGILTQGTTRAKAEEAMRQAKTAMAPATLVHQNEVEPEPEKHGMIRMKVNGVMQEIGVVESVEESATGLLVKATVRMPPVMPSHIPINIVKVPSLLVLPHGGA